MLLKRGVVDQNVRATELLDGVFHCTTTTTLSQPSRHLKLKMPPPFLQPHHGFFRVNFFFLSDK